MYEPIIDDAYHKNMEEVRNGIPKGENDEESQGKKGLGDQKTAALQLYLREAFRRRQGARATSASPSTSAAAFASDRTGTRRCQFSYGVAGTGVHGIETSLKSPASGETTTEFECWFMRDFSSPMYC
ncbi:hypothetical protein PF006_g5201 [Phytophthora fragariae]|uniref:Uncharacterized protein n=1 Tax=Phytophthora fragariae TaxID=53985 RepID=A0A6A3UG47_9STRA|nr:hypothetical protein PF006_g5201 [Phytophthora fragariae]